MKRSGLVLLALLAFTLSSCGSAPKEQFYTLRPIAERDPAISSPGFSVSVGPVTVPQLVARQQIVLTRSDNLVEILEQTRWAAPLENIMGHVIASNLAQLTGNPRMAIYSPDTRVDADYRVAVDVLRFESVLGTGSSLDARWTIRNTDEKVLNTGRTIISEPTHSQEVTALLMAHDRILATLSRNIVQALFDARSYR
jgi:uncharacterized lipoprotein YmbA